MKKSKIMAILTMAIIIICLSVTTVFAAPNTSINKISAVTGDWVNQNKYSSDYRYWSQGASSDALMRGYGCRLVAESKMLIESGAVVEAGFTPDNYLVWAERTGYVDARFRATYATRGAYNYEQYAYEALKSSGTNVSESELKYLSEVANSPLKVSGYTDEAKYDAIMDSLRAGNYVIVYYSGSIGTHYAYIGREESLSSGVPIVYDSYKSSSQTPYIYSELKNAHIEPAYITQIISYTVLQGNSNTNQNNVDTIDKSGSYTGYVSDDVNEALNINSKPSAGYAIGQIPEGAACTVYPNESQGSWYYVSYNGIEGYSYGAYINKTAPVQEVVPTPTPEPTIDTSGSYTGYISYDVDNVLNINSRPSAGYAIGQIPEGASCTVYPNESQGSWYYVSYNGVEGYSYGTYISKTAPAQEVVPTPTPQPTPEPTPQPTPEPEIDKSGSYTGYISYDVDNVLNINSQPSAGYAIGQIPEGAACTVYPNESQGSWYYVSYNGVEGYSYGSYISSSQPVNSYTGYISYDVDNVLNINSRPSAGYAIGQIPEGAACTVYPDKSVGSWYYVSYNGVEGYSYGLYIHR